MTLFYIQKILKTQPKQLKKIFLRFIHFWETERECKLGGAERGVGGERNPKQALHCLCRARCGARTHKPWDHDLSRRRTLNRLSHPGAPGKSSLERTNAEVSDISKARTWNIYKQKTRAHQSSSGSLAGSSFRGLRFSPAEWLRTLKSFCALECLEYQKLTD